LFADYQWPGNVRELANLLTRAAIHFEDLYGGSAEDVRAAFPEFGWSNVTSEAHRDGGVKPPVDRQIALEALGAVNGNRAAAARALGISRTTLWRLTRLTD
ncbi:helix-turn-helix domain-containing protein, partial [Pseudomonas sp.]|uniref:helix-turn-helix domain-containing protein n=1 Tax=Pseudomonas sp. TaxID=306 RepID=UPI0026102E56